MNFEYPFMVLLWVITENSEYYSKVNLNERHLPLKHNQ
ncbi:hypothetical protein B879_02934 [Cecembia lonarensis LW9]|uniref:Uncharacterized protein n=1 Tax=Cecembia lonarensis (strain CCUG 58316 / KCTC 22772 / LW9) TaxID=1225176 RepID=K1KWD5_CECL9|nr:hypothetical protein B879_02934 [Cecembia lonarensis LW9]